MPIQSAPTHIQNSTRLDHFLKVFNVEFEVK
jgi:hypothetical protein